MATERRIRELATEGRNPRTDGIDELPTLEIVRRINDEDATVAAVVRDALPAIAEAVDGIVARMRAGGRLVYAGAGTSGRLAMVDSVESVSTYGVPPGRVVALVAGGDAALAHPVEGAEDEASAGAAAVTSAGVSERDAVVGIAASGRTPYALGALATARRAGAFTVGISNNVPAPILADVDVGIALPTGPEVVAGSTRMKAGTAQKLVLNMISTAVMIRLGRVLGNRMIEVAVTNEKLRIRATGLVAEVVGVPEPEAARLLASSGDHVPTAILIGLRGLSPGEARAALSAAGGVLRVALDATERR
ncbi:MAG: N-acetylmuramic acid 6-phosphate etherase [Chloroflexota bacterium]